MKLSAKAVAERAKKIRLVLSDVDGVLTDGAIFHFTDTNGELVEFKGIHSHDSIALAWLAQSNIATGVISGRVSKGVEERLKLLQVSYIYQHRLDKANVFAEILEKAGCDASQAVFVGDDLPDLAVFRRAGLAIAPADARPELKAAAHWVTRAPGGRGALRELAELILRSQGLWDAILARYH